MNFGYSIHGFSWKLQHINSDKLASQSFTFNLAFVFRCQFSLFIIMLNEWIHIFYIKCNLVCPVRITDDKVRQLIVATFKVFEILLSAISVL